MGDRSIFTDSLLTLGDPFQETQSGLHVFVRTHVQLALETLGKGFRDGGLLGGDSARVSDPAGMENNFPHRTALIDRRLRGIPRA